MDFSFDVIGADDFERQHTRYEPLTDALRKLIDVGIHTAVDDETVKAALGHLEACLLYTSPSPRDRS